MAQSGESPQRLVVALPQALPQALQLLLLRHPWLLCAQALGSFVV